MPYSDIVLISPPFATLRAAISSFKVSFGKFFDLSKIDFGVSSLYSAFLSFRL